MEYDAIRRLYYTFPRIGIVVSVCHYLGVSVGVGGGGKGGWWKKCGREGVVGEDCMVWKEGEIVGERR